MRQLLRPLVEKDFSLFPIRNLANIYICTMTQYLENVQTKTIFPPPEIINGLAETLEQNQKIQIHVAETEKYAHVTYFFNGLKNNPFEKETDIFINSGKDNENNPSMKSHEIAEKVAEEIDKGLADLIVFNFANAESNSSHPFQRPKHKRGYQIWSIKT